MAYVPNYTHDVFLSYSSVDNVGSSLISEFHDLLFAELRRELKTRDNPDIFFDERDIESGATISDQVLSAVRGSATMVVFHSRGYEKSREWCCREYEEFKTDSLHIKKRLHVNSLDTLDIQSGQLREISLPRSRAYYYKQNENRFMFDPQNSAQKNPAGRTFKQETTLLAREIASYLDELRNASPAPRIFIASSTPKWDEHTENIKSSFHQRQYLVQRQSHWGFSDLSLEEDAEAMISKCDAFVSILEPPPNNGTTAFQSWEWGQKQVEIAKRLNTPIQLHWLPPGEGNEDERRELIQKPSARAVHLEEFKTLLEKALKDFLVTNDHTAPQEDAEDARKFLLVAANSIDADHCVPQLLQFIDQSGAGRNVWIDHRTPDSIESSAELKAALKKDQATGIIFADGDCTKEWIEARMRDFDTIRGELEMVPSLGYCEFDPVPKAPYRGYRPAGTVHATWDDLQPLSVLFE